EGNVVDVLWGPPQPGQAPGDAKFLAESQVVGTEKTAGEVQGGGEAVGAEAADVAVGRHEEEPRLGLEEGVDSDSPAEVGEGGAAAHADMRPCTAARPTARVAERTGPPAAPASGFQDGDAKAALRQPHRRRQTGEPRSDDHDLIRHGALPLREAGV